MDFSRNNVKNMFFLTPNQEGLLYHELRGEHQFLQRSFTLEGPLSAAVFAKALERLVDRYDRARTLFRFRGVIRPMQVVFKLCEPRFCYLDFTGVKADQIQAELLEKQRRPFHLEREPALRVCLIKWEPKRHVCAWCVHPMLLDHDGLTRLLVLFGNAYAGLIQGADLKLPEAAPFAPVVKGLAHRDREAAVRHWRTWLREVPETPPPPPFRDNQGGSRHTWDLPLIDDLRRLARGWELSLNVLLQTLWGLLLCRYLNREEIVFGLEVPLEDEPVIGSPHLGPTHTVVPLRFFLGEETSLRTLATDMERQTLSARRFAYLPPVELQKLLGRPIHYALGFRAAIPPLGLPGIRLGAWRESRTHRCALRLDVETGTVPTLCLSYKGLDETLVAAYASSLEHLARAALAGPDLPALELELHGQKRRVLLALNQETQGPPRDICRILAQGAKVGRVALYHEGKSLSYDKLFALAGNFAAALKEQGLGPTHLVALALADPVNQVAGVLGALFAKVPFLPLDPNWPEHRLKWLLNDSRCRLTVSEQTRPMLDQIPHLRWDAFPMAAFSHEIGHGEEPAYVIYTSGSTGDPKGVQVLRRGLANTIAWRAGEYGFDDRDTVLQLFAHTFDGYLTSVLAPLAGGAGLVLPKTPGNPQEVAALLSSYEITHFIVVPSYLSVLLPLLQAEQLRTMRALTLAGEQVRTDLIERIRRKMPRAEIINEYGPTENSVASTCKRHVGLENPIPIGKPIQGTRAYVLDRRSNPQPAFAFGELCLAGIGLAGGYLGQPQRTAALFPAMAHLNEPRVYRSGDLAWWTPDGNLVFQGRLDDQLKVRGFRIETGEIERAVLAQVGVYEAVVRPRARAGGETVPVAWFTGTVEASQLRKALAACLPAYMMPTHLIRLERLPMGPTGKIDSRALTWRRSKAIHPPKHTDQEACNALLAVFREVLGVFEEHDSFLEQGGDSIMALRIVSRLHKLGYLLELSDVFRYSFAELTGYLQPLDQADEP